MLGIGKTYFRIIDRQYLKDAPLGLIILNWIVQRVFRINSHCKFSMHFSSRLHGKRENLILQGNAPKLSLAVSGGCYFTCFEGKIAIGEGSIFANNVSIIADNHDYQDFSKFNSRSVTIGRKCWIGTGVTILPGVILGENVIVGANSVVTKSFTDNVVIAGNPARVIKSLN